jgi:hypothetical protein
LRANVAIGVGAAAVVGAAILWLTGPPDDAGRETAIAPVMHPDFSGVALAGSF